MKKCVMLIAIVLCGFLSYAQNEIKVEKYEPKLEYGEKIFLPMDYGKFNLRKVAKDLSIDGIDILKVEVVCTDYPKGIDLLRLNKRRFEQLKVLVPYLKKNKEVNYVTVRQTACLNKREAKKMFHGLVITSRPNSSIDRMRSEIDLIDKIISGEILKATDYTYRDDIPESDTSMDMVVVEALYDESGEVWSDSIGGGGYYVTEGVGGGITTINYRRDSTFLKIMERNPNWNRMMITADLTGSMYPYTAQILAWLQLNSADDKVKQFVFFNDGDMTPDHLKEIGKTGGIYIGNYSSYPKVKELAAKTMSSGGGGDLPENNIEALLKGFEECEECKDIVMVADNWAPIKDIRLLKKINKPIKIVLCGVWGGVNVDYLNLAKETGGSVHTMEDDLTGLTKMNEGETIEIGGILYKIEHGRFIKVSKI